MIFHLSVQSKEVDYGYSYDEKERILLLVFFVVAESGHGERWVSPQSHMSRHDAFGELREIRHQFSPGDEGWSPVSPKYGSPACCEDEQESFF